MSNIQCSKDALLSGPSIPLFPFNVKEFGGLTEALVYQQIQFLSKSVLHEGKQIKAARISYTRLRNHIPSATRRTIISVVARLQKMGAINVIKTKRVNLLTISDGYQFKTIKTDQNCSRMLVFTELLNRLSILEAIALQQIHIRCAGSDGSVWLIRKCNQLHNEIFPFVSLATVTRLFATLRKQNLIFVKPYISDDGKVNSYRVNYLKVAELLDVPPPCVTQPPKHIGKWTNPLFPSGQVIAKV